MFFKWFVNTIKQTSYSAFKCGRNECRRALRDGAGYHLTFARTSSNADSGGDEVLAIIRNHLPSTTLSSDVGAELSFTLPADGTSKFATLFKELDGELERLGFASYGISCTTLEEVFLSIAKGGVGGVGANSIGRRTSMDGKNGGSGVAVKEAGPPPVHCIHT